MRYAGSFSSSFKHYSFTLAEWPNQMTDERQAGRQAGQKNSHFGSLRNTGVYKTSESMLNGFLTGKV